MSFSLRGQVGPVSLAACIVLNSSPATSASLPALKIDPALLGAGTVPSRAEAAVPTSVTTTSRPVAPSSPQPIAAVPAPPVAVAAVPSAATVLPPTRVETPKPSGVADTSVGAGDTPSPTPPAAAAKRPLALIESPKAQADDVTQGNITANNADPNTRIVADKISGISDTQTRAEGHVELRKLDMRLTADQVTHTQADDEVDASGTVLFTRPNEEISGPHLRLKLTDNLGFFENPAYKISSTRKRHLVSGASHDQNPVAHGSATRMDFLGEGKYQLTDSHVLVLRFGQILYSGTVDGMSNQTGFFELQADNNSKLIDALKNHPEMEKISESEGKVIVHFKSQFDASLLNRYLAEKGIYLNHLVNKKMSLEEQFLALTNK